MFNMLHKDLEYVILKQYSASPLQFPYPSDNYHWDTIVYHYNVYGIIYACQDECKQYYEKDVVYLSSYIKHVNYELQKAGFYQEEEGPVCSCHDYDSKYTWRY